jgi:hypothetical protein
MSASRMMQIILSASCEMASAATGSVAASKFGQEGEKCGIQKNKRAIQ